MSADEDSALRPPTDTGGPDGAGRAPRRGDRRLDFLFGVLGTFLQVGTGVIMLPAAAATLSPSSLTFWYVFLTIQTLALLIEFGFTPTLSRNFTYVFSGARVLRTEGVPESTDRGVSVELLANLLRASRRLYFFMALIVLLLLGVGGTVYLAALSTTTTDIAYIWPAWACFLAAMTAQTSYSWQGCIMVGADRMRQNYQVFTVARLVQVVLSLGGLYFFPNILTLAAAYAVSVLVGRVHARLVVADVLRMTMHVRTELAKVREILRTIVPTAAKLGWVTLGEFFTNRFSLFAVSLAVGAAAAAQYAIALQAMLVLLTVSQIATAMSIPRMAAAQLANDKPAMADIYAFCLVLAVSLLALGSVSMIVLGGPILRFIGSETTLPALPVLILLSVIYTVAVSAHTAMNVITAGNRVPHTRAVLLTGAATTIGVIMVYFANGSLFAFVAVQGITQLAFNFWRWPLYAFRQTGLTVSGLLPSAVRGAQRVVLGRD